jgi:V/A-type H+-transporting ATPase subunit E
MAHDPEQRGGGVEQLLARIRDEGVAAARQEAERILAQAKEEAASIRARARLEAESTVAEARAGIEVEQQAGKAALRLAARDTLLELHATIRRDFEYFVRRLVTRECCDVEFIRDLVLALAGQVSQRCIAGRNARIFVDADLLAAHAAEADADSVLGAALNARTLELSAEMLREGIELIPATASGGGARVRLVDENLELDLGDEAISRLLMRFLLPRFRHIIEEHDGA